MRTNSFDQNQGVLSEFSIFGINDNVKVDVFGGTQESKSYWDHFGLECLFLESSAQVTLKRYSEWHDGAALNAEARGAIFPKCFQSDTNSSIVTPDA